MYQFKCKQNNSCVRVNPPDADSLKYSSIQFKGSPRISYSGMEDNKLQLHTLIDYHPYYYLFYYHLTTPCCSGAISIDAILTLLAFHELDKYIDFFWILFCLTLTRLSVEFLLL